MQRSRMVALGFGVTESNCQSLFFEKKVLMPKAAPQYRFVFVLSPFQRLAETGTIP